MASPVLRILSYVPNPRVWKALFAADLCGVEVAVSGDGPGNLAAWLWDHDARSLPEDERSEHSRHARPGRRGSARHPLNKTGAFMAAHPFGRAPAARGQ